MRVQAMADLLAVGFATSRPDRAGDRDGQRADPGGMVDDDQHQPVLGELVEQVPAATSGAARSRVIVRDWVTAVSAVITPAFDLAPVQWVMHAVGPKYTRRDSDADLLPSAYRSALARADEVGARSVAFPSISTGVYGYPAGPAARLSVDALRTADTQVQDELLVAFSDHMAQLWNDALRATS